MPTTTATPNHFTGQEVVAQLPTQHGLTREEKRKRGFRRRIYWLIGTLVLIVVALYEGTLPPLVRLIQPSTIRITESIAVTGSVKGRKESAVGAQMNGTVESLLVREGDAVTKGQLIATIRNTASEAAVAQAKQAVETAKAMLAQAEMKPLASDLEALRAKTDQAGQAYLELSARSERANIMVQQSTANIRQSQHQLDASKASLANAGSQASLAQKNYDRASTLYESGAISKQSLDEAETALKAAQANAQAAQANVDSAQIGVENAKSAERAARLDVLALESQLAQAAAARRAALQQYLSLKKQPLSENVNVLRARLQDAEAALKTANAQAQYANVIAPFDGIITDVLSETGTAVNPAGILKVAEMAAPQISANLDEYDMADLHVGQKALISSAANASERVEGRVIRIGPSVDFSRGTVEVRIVPNASAAWLMPGQTVNVNLIKNENIARLAVPARAIRQETNGSAVLVISNGRTESRNVTTGGSVGDMVPVLSGLNANDMVVDNAETLATHARVRVAR